MARAWLIDSRGIAGKVKNATHLSTSQIKDCGASRECPNCHHTIDNSDVSVEWPGLPAGVKFDPSDIELLEHLAGKFGYGNTRPHLFIDEFIPTLDGGEGICYTHPENLPGAKKDGSSIHFFHRTSKAYATGPRKRRKIHGPSGSADEHVRWHKTGKTKAVIENGAQKGCKKIMVLYKSSKKGSKPDKSNWVMHQYHLGTKEDETDGEFVVSKIFYQQQLKPTDKRDSDNAIEESVPVVNRAGPTTPNTYTPNPPRPAKRALDDEIDEETECLSNSKHAFLDQIDEEHLYKSPIQHAELTFEVTQPPPEAVHFEDEQAEPEWLAGESQVPEDPEHDMDTLLFCNEGLDTYISIDDFRLENDGYFYEALNRDSNAEYRIPNLAKPESDSPLDLGLADLQFGSQESITGWF